jgi:hypothetical protein
MEITFPWKSYVKFILNADFLPGIEDVPEMKYQTKTVVPVLLLPWCQRFRLYTVI